MVFGPRQLRLFDSVEGFREHVVRADDDLQRLPQIVAGSGEETGLSKISLLSNFPGGVQRLACPLTVGNIVDRHQNFRCAQRFVAYLQRVHHERSYSTPRQIDLDAMILDKPFAVPEAGEEVAQS